MLFPSDGCFRAERRFRNGAFRRSGGDSAKVQFHAAGGVHGAEECSDVVHAADIVQQDGDGELVEGVVRGGGLGGSVGKTFGHGSADAPAAHRRAQVGRLIATVLLPRGLLSWP